MRSGVVSEIQALAPDSDPARYLSFPGPRSTENTSRRRRPSSRRGSRAGACDQPAMYGRATGLPSGATKKRSSAARTRRYAVAKSSRSASVSPGRSRTSRLGARCTSTGQRAANGTYATQCSVSRTTRRPSASSASRTSRRRERPVASWCAEACVSSCSVRGVRYG